MSVANCLPMITNLISQMIEKENKKDFEKIKELYEDRIKNLEKQVEELKAVNEYKILTYVTKKLNFECRLVKKEYLF